VSYKCYSRSSELSNLFILAIKIPVVNSALPNGLLRNAAFFHRGYLNVSCVAYGKQQLFP
jgi:hypothetical protein